MNLKNEDKKNEIHRRIREAAEKKFSRCGYYETVVDDIADEAGVGKGTVYRHYGDKEQLFLEITCFAARRLYRRLNREKFTESGTKENLQKIAQIHGELFKDAREVVKLIVREGFQFMDKEHTEFYEIVGRVIEELREVFDRGIRAGEIDSSYNPETLARFYLGRMWSIARGAIVFDEDFELVNQQYDLAVDIFLHGIQ